MGESDTIEEAMGRYHAELAADARRVAACAPCADPKRRASLIGALAFFALITLFLGTSAYLLIDVTSQSTTMITHRMTGNSANFAIAALIYLVICVPFLFSSMGSLANRLFLALTMGGLGSLALGVALHTRAEKAAETAIFADGGRITAESFPILRTRVDHGRGVSYWAVIDPHGHGRTMEMKISESDLYRINAGSSDGRVPRKSFCATLQVQTHGSDQRILWSQYERMPSAWIADCPVK